MNRIKLILLTILVLVTFTSFNAQAQTKRIEHRSHSGSRADFNLFIRSSNFGPNESNPGIAPTPMRLVEKAQLDSVIFVRENVAIMVTSIAHVKGSIDARDKYTPTKCINPGLWRPGHDTVYYHPLFSKQYALDSIKDVLKKEYHFRNDIDQVKFVGYSNHKPVAKKSIQKKITDTLSPLQPETTIAQTKTVTETTSDKKQHKKSKVWLTVGLVLLVSVSVVATILHLNKSEHYTP